MSNSNVLKKFIQTKKSNEQKNINNVYTFKVFSRSNKFQIKNVLEKVFGVKVEKINVSLKKPFTKNRKFKTSLEKKAFIKLKKGYNINGFGLSDENKSFIDNNDSDLALNQEKEINSISSFSSDKNKLEEN